MIMSMIGGALIFAMGCLFGAALVRAGQKDERRMDEATEGVAHAGTPTKRA